MRENVDLDFFVNLPLLDLNDIWKFNKFDHEADKQNRSEIPWQQFENKICEEYGVRDPYALQKNLNLFEMAFKQEDGWTAYQFVKDYNIDNDEYDIDDCGEYYLYNPNEEWIMRVDISNDYAMYVYHKDGEELKKQIDYCKNNMILYTGKEYMECYEEEYDI